jgi:hypothetical protein
MERALAADQIRAATDYPKAKNPQRDMRQEIPQKRVQHLMDL